VELVGVITAQQMLVTEQPILVAVAEDKPVVLPVAEVQEL
jgi:hypothetical protein